MTAAEFEAAVAEMRTDLAEKNRQGDAALARFKPWRRATAAELAAEARDQWRIDAAEDRREGRDW